MVYSIPKLFTSVSQIYLITIIAVCGIILVNAAIDDGSQKSYEFGFKLQGIQHRYEKKDNNGIITGNFGFLTGDGSYSQAEYATDENGKYKVKAKSSYRRNKNLVKKEISRLNKIVDEPDTTVDRAPKKPLNNLEKIIKTNLEMVKLVENSKPIQTTETPTTTTTTTIAPVTKTLSTTTTAAPSTTTNVPSTTTAATTATAPITTTTTTTTTSTTTAAPTTVAHSTTAPPSTTKATTIKIEPTENTKRTLKSISYANKFPPSSADITESLSDLLYKFKYSTDYHGHHEEGSRNGNKKGGYFSIGRDNIRRTVDYVANENGYVPHLLYEAVDRQYAPNAQNDKNGLLKEFEFKWFNTKQK